MHRVDGTTELPGIRLFGPLSIEEGGRSLGPGDLGGVRPKQVLEILLAARGIACRSTASPSSSGETSAPGTPPARCRRSSPAFAATSPRTGIGPARLSSPSPRRTGSRPSSSRWTSTASTSCSSARHASRRARPARSLEEALTLVRGDVLEDEPYSSWALDVRGSYQGRVLGRVSRLPTLPSPSSISRVALAHSEAAAVLDRFSERAQRTAMLALYALGRQHEALARYRAYPHPARRRAGARAEPGDPRARIGDPGQENPQSLLPRPIGAEARAHTIDSVRLLGRRSSSTRSRGRSAGPRR